MTWSLPQDLSLVAVGNRDRSIFVAFGMYKCTPPPPRKQLTWQWKHVTFSDVSPIKIMWFYIVMLVFGVFFFLNGNICTLKPNHNDLQHTHRHFRLQVKLRNVWKGFQYETRRLTCFFLKDIYVVGVCFFVWLIWTFVGWVISVWFFTCLKGQVSTLWNIRWQYAKRAALCKDRVGITNKHKKRFQRITAWSTFVWTYTTNSHEKTFPLFHLAHDILRWCNLN